MGVNFSSTMRKPQHLKLTKSARTEKLYLVNNIIKENGHGTQHLSLNHPVLNPIELA
jgi:hypothetical protein